MIENTPQDRLDIAQVVNCHTSKSGKTLYPQWIETPEELIEQYREYARQDLLQRYGEDGDPRLIEVAADMYADLAARNLEHDLPALTYLFKRYLRQH